MKELRFKFKTNGEMKGFINTYFPHVCPSLVGGKDDEYVCQNGNGCLNCWLRSGLIYEKDNLENASNSDKVIKSELIQNRIKELKNSRAGYMVCGISCNHAVVAELERLLKEIE